MSICKKCGHYANEQNNSVSLYPSGEGQSEFVRYINDTDTASLLICYECIQHIRPKILYIGLTARLHISQRPVANIQLLSCLSNVTHLTINNIDCSNVQQHIVSLITANTMPMRSHLMFCNLNTIVLIDAMETNTTIRELDITHNNMPILRHQVLVDSMIRFIRANKTCHTLEFYMASYHVDAFSQMQASVENNYSLLNLFGESYDSPRWCKWQALHRVLQRNANYTRKHMQTVLVDIIIALFPLIRQFGIGPYVIMEIFGHLRQYYDKFWHKELADVSIRVINKQYQR